MTKVIIYQKRQNHIGNILPWPIMLEIIQRADQGRGSLSIWIWLWSSGYPRNNRQLKNQFLVRILWQWSTEWKHSKAWGTSWGWWEFWFPFLHTSMGGIFQLSTIIIIWVILLEKRVTRFVIVQGGRVLWWELNWRLTFQKITILHIWWQKLSYIKRDKITLATYCMISMMNTTSIETRYFWLTSVITLTG